MLLSHSTQQSIQFINSVTHEGKVVVVGTGSDGRIYYTIKQDGYEDTHNSNSSGWEDLKTLGLPNEDVDTSVIDQEKKNLTYPADAAPETAKFILRSRYQTADESAVTPVQLISALGHLYVFRQSKDNTLLVDRFVLDGMNNTLNRKYEVRYQQSRQRYEPAKNKKTTEVGLSTFDSLSFRDKNGKFFYEPTTEISIVQNLYKGWFSVVLLPTNELDKYRWHIFAYNSSTKKVELVSIRASEEGLFDVKDATVFDPKPGEPSVLVPRSVPGIIRRSFSFELEDKPGTFLQIANGLSATKYDVQSEVLTQDGEPQLIKDATKVMLVIPTDQGNTVALSFAAAKDGTLSQLSETPDLEVLRSVNRAVLLPLNTLDNIRSIGDSTPPVGGAIASVKRTEDDRVQITSTQAATLEPGNSVKIQGTTHYNGYYLAQKIDDNTFEITAKWVDGDSKDWQLGTWEEIPKEQSGLIFDGIITAAESTSDGKLRITSLNHGLENGDGVQISDTQGLNGTYPVMAIDGNSFTLDVTWQPGKAANVKLESRGISFDGTGDYIDIPALLELKSPSPDYDFGETYSAWIQVPSSMAGEQIIVGQKGQLMQLMLEDSKVVLKIQCSDGFHQIEDPNPVPINQWVHYAGSFSCIHNKTSDGTKTTETMLVLCRNGQRVATKVVPTMPETKSQDQDSDGSSNRKQQSWLPEFLIGGTATSNYFTGKIADVQVWNRVREPQEILDSMYLRLTGKEVGLVGYWRLGAIAEGDQREVVDFSVFGNNGVVHGDGDLFVSAVTLERTLKDEVTQIVKYTNDDLVAVTQRATYEESFEFKLNRSLDPTLDPTLDFTPDPNNVDGNGHKIFEFSYWGKANRNSEKRESFTGVMETFQLKDGWYQASARFTVPEGVKLVRCFELSNVLGNWTTLEIRKHQMQLVSDAITEAKYSDEVNLPTLDDQQVERREAFQKLARYEQEAAALMLRKWQLERASKSGVKHNLKSQIEALQTEVATLQSSYDDEVGKFENYWCKITAKHSGKVIGVEGGKTNDGANVLQWGWQNVDNQKWRFKPVDKPADKPAEYYKIVCKHSATEKVLNVNEPRNRNGGNISLWHSANVDHQKWKREPVDNNSAYKIIAKHSGKVLDVSQGHSADGTNIQQWDWSNVENQKWTIETLEEHCNNNIQDANQKLGNKRTELARAESQLRDINEAQNRLSIVTARLDFVQREMAVLTSGQSGKEPVALEMATLKTDTRKLKTQGALLNFVCPASRITAIETCEGNVQLSYFDDQGKMRQTNFDATADSRNAQFEQWLPDQLPVCLQLSGDGSINYGNLNLANRSFTVEFWAKRDQLDRMAMILSQGETEVNKGLHIGFRSDGKFTFAFYSDDLDTDSPYNDFEWHHWVCVYELEGKTRTIYRDGEQIGQDHANKIYQGSGNLVLGQRFDAKHSFVGRLAEVRIWQVALTQEEIKINSKIRLSGNEPGLLAYYPLHEPSQVRDLTGSQKDAEILGTASWCRSTVPIGQFKPSEISLDGVDDYLEIANSEAINFATNQDFTVEAWIKADRIQQDTKNTDNDIIEKWSGQSGYPYVIRYVNTSGKIYAARYDGTKSASINSTITVNDGVFHHVAFVKAGTQLLLYIDGDLAKGGSGTDTVSGNTQNDSPLYIGCRGGNSKINFFTGQIAELRLWNKARTEQEIQSDMNRRLTGEEDGLVGYWALHEIQGDKVSDLKSANNGIVNGAVTIQDTSLPIWGDALISCEYSTIGLNSNQKKSAMMRRFLAFPSLAGINLLAGQRIEELELVWAGNAQVNPTLLGYIEGAPPVPSENLTVEDNYNGATSVQLLSSEEVSYSWNREQDAGLGATASLFLGVDKNLDLLEVEVKAGFQGDLSLQYSFLNSTNISASSGINITNGLSLVGNQEYDAKFTKLGMRFIPKNVGYALVVSGLADVYVIRLNRTKKIVGYQIVPNKNIPLDVNTITFLINPAYTMNGSLDGMTGSQATSERFFQYIPELRSQYGSLYPASYFRLIEAYDLKNQINYRDERRKSYFAQFDSRLVDETSLGREVNNAEYQTDEIGVGKDDVTQTLDEEDSLQAKIEESADQQKVAANEKEQQIKARFKDASQQIHATTSFAGWQKKMENIQLLASKRNIVNTYVWDADGGLYIESQQFMNSFEHTIGGSFSLEGAIGGQHAFKGFGYGFDLTAQRTVHMTQTMTKTEAQKKGFELNIDLSGVEGRGITDYKDRPILPGEKVDRYRFMTFYLEGSTNNFNDFFAYVVDPEWLASNDEEARALRQVDTSSPNKTWRVLHRVTYVERPTLMG